MTIKTILCVEDDRFIGEMYIRSLKKAGYDVEWVVAYGGPEFLAGRAGERKYFQSDDYQERWRLQDLTKNTTKRI